MAEVQKDPEKEAAMLLVSAELFGQAGFRETKTEVIAKAAGVSKGLVFHYFGNKSQLYLATYDYVTQFFYDHLDLSVWQKANDLIEMVVESTTYKIQLQLDFPIQFQFLMRAYGEMNSLPESLKQALTERLTADVSTSLALVEPLTAKLPLKEGISREEVNDLLNLLLSAETQRIQKELALHPEWQTVEDLAPVIQRLRRELTILQFGFMPED
ncbi:TetR/AcrR family transcriptional regulator [Enterococcus sp. HY326]|uniref:TetR/AcrR family transcriptional regulator n=1 Tax=Enterococcus sp. HY326 TaxID=2971265 RepID=UPI00224066C7|nr:TetR/AcrR family transcriptional regulator [Enterococcus sp. HY326]